MLLLGQAAFTPLDDLEAHILYACIGRFFSVLSSVPSYGYITVCLSCFLLDVHPDYLVLAVTEKAAMNHYCTCHHCGYIL